MIQFAQPGYFVLLAVVLAMAATAIWLARWQRRAREDFAGPQVARWPVAPAWPRLALVLLAAVLIVIAAARPQWGSQSLVRQNEGIDLVIVLDISQSMQATDASPNRYGLAREELNRLIASLRGNRIGLVLFAGSAILRSPLTTDVQAMMDLIRRAEQETGLTSTGSDIGAGLSVAARILESSDAAGKAVLVVSDGEDHVGRFLEPARDLRQKGISVFSAGIGTPEGTTLGDANRGFKVDAQGRPVITRLQEANLLSIASEGGGAYLRLGGSNSLLSLRDELSRLETTPFGEEEQRIPIERFQPFVIAALLLLAEAWLLPAGLLLPAARLGSMRPHAALGLLLLSFVIGACSDGDPLRDRNAAANELYAAGDFEGALAAYEELLAERPDLPELGYNAGNALHRLGEYERAVAETARALPPPDAKRGAATYYALGNHFLGLQRLEQAYDSYRNALLLDPDDADAKYNLELTLLLLTNQQQQQQTQPGSQGSQQPQGEPGSEQQQPGQQPQQPGQPQQPPQPGTPPGDVVRQLQEALRGIDESVTFSEAIEILDLLREQQRGLRQTPSRGAPTGPDY